ncbi:serine/threonine-protein kinase [Sorangium sp. So ce131]|uniref:serine/threonine-protein kinase n=1 Tax=Sorangium sp. So ce131 TaxID=3133282 RepID=UPI003F5DF290
MSLGFIQGTLFDGRYRVVCGIATGAMGTVYEVVHVETERRRALKVMHPHLAENPAFQARFKLEARIAARIATEHIVEVFDAGIDAETGMPFLVMELLRGEELSTRIRRAGRLSPEETVAYLRQTAVALDKTHAAGVVHRDIKPSNLFLAQSDDDDELRIKVLDFGIAKLVAETALGAATTAALGTPLYMAPEQFSGRSISKAVDIFALGMVAYTLLVGKAYWLNDMREFSNTLAFAATAIFGPQEPACARAASEGVQLPPAFDPWFAKATAREPEARFTSASAAVEALAEVFHVAPVTARPSAFVSATETPIGRGSQGLTTAAPVADEPSTGAETQVAPAMPRYRSVIAAAALALLGGGAFAFSSLGDGGPALGTTGPAQAAPSPAVAARAAPSAAPIAFDLMAPAPKASAPRVDVDHAALTAAAVAASASAPAALLSNGAVPQPSATPQRVAPKPSAARRRSPPVQPASSSSTWPEEPLYAPD